LVQLTYCAGTIAVLQFGILGLPLKQLNEGDCRDETAWESAIATTSR
jgi:hypothetical protein